MNFYTAAVTLFLVLDPVGNIPAYLAILSRVEPRRRMLVIVREMLIALAVLGLFLFFGRYILEGMQISQAALSMAGGVILFLVALRMIFPSATAGDEENYDEEPLIVPLAIPFVAGPSALALVTLLATQAPERIWVWFGALCVAWVAGVMILLAGEALRRLLGPRVIRAVVRLMGMILTTLAIQMLLGGVRAFVVSLRGV